MAERRFKFDGDLSRFALVRGSSSVNFRSSVGRCISRLLSGIRSFEPAQLITRTDDSLPMIQLVTNEPGKVNGLTNGRPSVTYELQATNRNLGLPN